MNQRRLKVTVMVAAAVMLITSQAMAQGFRQGDGPRERGRGQGAGLGQMLDLNDEQRAQMQAIRREMHQGMQEQRTQLQALRQQLQQAWAAETPNAQTINSLQRQIAEIRSAMRTEQLEAQVAIHSILTNEQRARFAEMPHKGRHGRRGFHGCHGRGEGFGRGPRDGAGHGGFGMGARMAERLNLDNGQQAQIQELLQQMREELEPVREDLNELRQQLHQLHQAEQLDVQAIQQIHQRMDALRQIMSEARVETRIAVLNVLTPEQRAELNELREQRHQRHVLRRGGHRGHGRGAGF